MILYLDTSALVKYYILEPGSKEVANLIESVDLVGTVAVTYSEMASALSKAARMEWINEDDAKRAWKDFCSHWPAYSRLMIDKTIIERAAVISWEQNLRTLDALHLAAALEWQKQLEIDVALATFDQSLWFAAKQTNLSTWPDHLPNH